ncbi:MAG TPA: hypothetical protein VFE47_25160 [Tepidisphaeraceae bacterium]|jgi:hypothetical protein|nr:hypothetical protein [Tepidisphaeraceae bacterium]
MRFWRFKPHFSIAADSRKSYTWVMLRDTAILDRVIASDRIAFPRAVARQILKFGFPAKDIARYKKLSYKAQQGSLTPKERGELEDYVNVGDLLMVMKAKAEASLRKESPAA